MNIFVAKLNYGTTSDSLRELFETIGEVSSAKVIIDKYTGKSRGFGFVEMDNDDEANRAIEELNEREFEGNVIVIKKAKPREDNRRSGGGGGGGFNRGGGGGGGGFNRGGGGGGGYNRDRY
jgi:RNA recognition motif-containing protein